MRVDKGVGLIVYREKENEKEYLILKRDKNWTGWEIPKGHLEFDSHIGTVFVELNEEAGLEPVDVISIESKSWDLTFQFEEDGESVVSYFKVFEVEVDEDSEIDTSNNPSEEHSDFMWTTREEVLDKLEYEEQRELFRE